jgi:hypothetical protein
MSTIRPAGLPAVPQRPAQTPALTRAGGSRAAAFFQAAISDTTAATPVAVQMQTQPQRQPPARPFAPSAEPPQKLLRPGSLLNILV